MKILGLIIISLVASLPVSYLAGSDYTFDYSIIQSIYNALSIIFSVGLGLIVSVSLNEIKNPDYILSIRKNLDKTRNKFIFLFILCTILFIFYKDIPSYKLKYFLTDAWSYCFTIIFFVLSLCYFINNFMLIQNFRNEISDKILEEEKQKIK